MHLMKRAWTVAGPGRRVAALVMALALAGIAAPACKRGERRPHESLTAGAEPLRSAFNADVGKPRIVILAAPT
jgi:hypothetical protein